MSAAKHTQLRECLLKASEAAANGRTLDACEWIGASLDELAKIESSKDDLLAMLKDVAPLVRLVGEGRITEVDRECSRAIMPALYALIAKVGGAK